MSNIQKLFQNITIRSMVLKNRIVLPPMVTLLANRDGTVSQRMIDYYTRRAAGGAGLIEVEAATVDPEQFTLFPAQLRIFDDRFVEGFSRLTEAVHAHGAKIALQLQHPGRETNYEVTGLQPVAPSPIRSPIRPDVPRELSLKEIITLVERFGEGARRAKQAGFDAVEIHGAHGYLVCQFLSRYSNKRSDQYGGNLRRRARFALEIVQRVREKVGTEYPILFRISAEEFIEEGLVLDETKQIAQWLEEAGVDVISVSGGNQVTLEWMLQPMLFRPGCIIDLAAAIKEVVRIPVIGVGRIIDPKLAERFLEQNKTDLIAVGRALIADPEIPQKARQGRLDEIIRCISCNSCSVAIRSGGPIGCLINPEAGREGHIEERTPRNKKVLILGGSPTGLEAARVAALRGHQVTLWEEKPKLGGRWSWLIKPYIPHQMKKLKEAGVTVRLGEAITPQTVTRFKPDVIIVTPSASPIVPEIPGISQGNIYTADEVLEGRSHLGNRVVVLGAGNIGFETAWFLSRQGAKVTILESSQNVAYGLHYAVGRVVDQHLSRRGVRILTGVEITGIDGNRIIFKDKQGDQFLETDSVVLALGSRTDDALIQSLKGGNFQLLHVNYCEESVQVYKAIQEGGKVARLI